MDQTNTKRRSVSGVLIALLPFSFTVVVFSFLDKGTTLSVRDTAFVPVALLALAAALPVVVSRSNSESHEGRSQVTAYKLFRSWPLVILVRCVLIGVGAVLCVYLWLRLIGERIEGDIEQAPATVIEVGTGGAKGGCSTKVTFEVENGPKNVCVSRIWREPLMPNQPSEGQLVVLTIKENFLSRSVTSIQALQ